MKIQHECPYCKKPLGKIEDLGHEKPVSYVCNTPGCPGQKKAWVDEEKGKLVPKDM